MVVHLVAPSCNYPASSAKADASYHKMLTELSESDLLLIDDLGVAPLNEENRRDLLEIVDERYNTKSTIITSQLLVKL